MPQVNGKRPQRRTTANDAVYGFEAAGRFEFRGGFKSVARGKAKERSTVTVNSFHLLPRIQAYGTRRKAEEHPVEVSVTMSHQSLSHAMASSPGRSGGTPYNFGDM
jgi:hypothetical protein